MKRILDNWPINCYKEPYKCRLPQESQLKCYFLVKRTTSYLVCPLRASMNIGPRSENAIDNPNPPLPVPSLRVDPSNENTIRLTFRALALRQSLRRRSNARNICL